MFVVTLPNYTGTSFKFDNSGTSPKTVADVITAVLPLVYVFAGLALLLMLIFGGITLMTAAGDQNKTKEGYGRITAGLIGFIIIFISYFVMQIIEVVLGIKIL